MCVCVSEIKFWRRTQRPRETLRTGPRKPGDASDARERERDRERERERSSTEDEPSRVVQ